MTHDRPGFPPSDASFRPATRDDLLADAVDVAPRLLGARISTLIDGQVVAVRITEVEAYRGLGTGAVVDPGSHARMGRTARNATMWGEPGHLYVYLSHGIHSCANVVCGPDGVAGGLLLRAGEVLEGTDAAARRRPAARMPRDFARGPGRLGQALGLRHPIHDGIDAIPGDSVWPPERAGARVRLDLARDPVHRVATGPRVGVAGIAGTNAFPWRFWIGGDSTVSAFRPGRGAVEGSSPGG